MRLFLTASLILVARDVLARPPHTLTSTLLARQTADPLSKDCNATCAAFTAVKHSCNVPHCGCNVKYLRVQGECLLCLTETPEDAATVQLALDVEQTECHVDGIPINFRLHLPPDAEAIVDEFDRQSATLRHLQRAFLALQIAGGHVGLIIVLVFSVFSRRVHRDPTFFNFCITWIISSVVFSILLYRGTDGNTTANTLGRIAPNTCLVQAALTSGAQVMTACSTTALITQLWIGLRSAIHGDISRGSRQKQWITIVLIGLPYVLFLAFVIPSISDGKLITVIQGRPRAMPANFYCINIQAVSLLRSVYGTTLGFLIIAAVFDLLIIIMLYHHWKTFRYNQTAKGTGSVISLSILLRVIIFSIYRVVVAIAYGTILNGMGLLQILPSGLLMAVDPEQKDINFVLSNVPIWVDMLQATIPFVAFLVFGVNTDVLSVVASCQRNRKSQFSTM